MWAPGCEPKHESQWHTSSVSPAESQCFSFPRQFHTALSTWWKPSSWTCTSSYRTYVSVPRSGAEPTQCSMFEDHGEFSRNPQHQRQPTEGSQ